MAACMPLADSSSMPAAAKKLEAVTPGETALTRILRGANSLHMTRTMARRAPFVAEYTAAPGIPMSCTTEVLKHTEAPSTRSGARARISMRGPLTLTLNIKSNSAAVASVVAWKWPKPALRKRAWTSPPSFSFTAAANASASSGLPASFFTAIKPAFSAASKPSVLVPVTKTLVAPSFRARVAAARPMPDVPPVTTTFLPANRICCLGGRACQIFGRVAVVSRL
mmetsp:Transcript_10134/g.30703  ORF Transcript_10134/g.30703 Transcript_10134/m.30703 type:complete len:224 (-) Transcript_10134:19-690(-)